jgi:hypothetical protein
MNIPAAIIEAMVAAGVSAEQIAAVLRISEEWNAGKIEARREANRIRQQRWRNAHNAVMRDITRYECDKERPPNPTIDNSYPPLPPKKLPAPRAKHTLPEGWEPNESDIAYGKKLGLNGRFEGQLEAMKLWAEANRILKADWHATLKSFLRKEAEKLAMRDGKGPVGTKSNWRIGADGKWTKEPP